MKAPGWPPAAHRLFEKKTTGVKLSRIRISYDRHSCEVYSGRNDREVAVQMDIKTFKKIEAALEKKTAASILDEFASLAYREAKNSFTIPGIGKLVLVKRNARLGRNPATGEQIQIPAKTVVKFRVAKACKDAVLGKK